MKVIEVNQFDTGKIEEFYNKCLVTTYPENELHTLPIVSKFLKARRAKLLVAVHNNEIVGGILYSVMEQSKVLFIQYVATSAEWRYKGIEPVLCNLAVEDTEGECLFTILEEVKNTRKRKTYMDFIGFRELAVKYIKPKLAYDKELDNNKYLSVLRQFSIPEQVFTTFLGEYFRDVCFTPNYLNNSVYQDIIESIRGTIIIETEEI